MLKFKLKFAAITVAVLVFVTGISLISIKVYGAMNPAPVYQQVEAPPEIEGDVFVGELALDESRKIGKLFGYENSWEYRYLLDLSPEVTRSKKGDNWLEKKMRAAGRGIAGKRYEMVLTNYFKLGYDLSTMTSDDFLYDKESRVLTVRLPNLELDYTPDYDESVFEAHVGIFRSAFTEEERRLFYKDSIDQGVRMFISENEDEIEKGNEYTQQAIREILQSVNEISSNVREIRFVVRSEEVLLSLEEYKNKTKNKEEKENEQ